MACIKSLKFGLVSVNKRCQGACTPLESSSAYVCHARGRTKSGTQIYGSGRFSFKKDGQYVEEVMRLSVIALVTAFLVLEKLASLEREQETGSPTKIGNRGK